MNTYCPPPAGCNPIKAKCVKYSSTTYLSAIDVMEGENLDSILLKINNAFGGGGGIVSSFNGRVGQVLSMEGDYSLDMLGDASIISPVVGQLLHYNGSGWVNFTPSYITGNQNITLTGDIIGSGTTSISTSIPTGSIGYAKIQNVSSQTLLGRYSGTSGIIQEITIGTGLTLSTSTGILDAIGSGGTVTSVGLSMPSIFSVTNSPITSSGAISTSLVVQGANTFFGGPASGFSATPSFRLLVSGDIPSLDTSKIGTGIFDSARLATGTANSTTYLRGDSTWVTISVPVAGSFTFSGTGAILSFDIIHGLSVTPTNFSVQAASPDARGISYVEALNNGSTEVLRVYYDVAPPSGSSNGILKWIVSP
jgi:hypothetical protein